MFLFFFLFSSSLLYLSRYLAQIFVLLADEGRVGEQTFEEQLVGIQVTQQLPRVLLFRKVRMERKELTQVTLLLSFSFSFLLCFALWRSSSSHQPHFVCAGGAARGRGLALGAAHARRARRALVLGQWIVPEVLNVLGAVQVAGLGIANRVLDRLLALADAEPELSDLGGRRKKKKKKKKKEKKRRKK
jgi:hypothetical protein